ncbi:MAG: hypothetical protein AB7K09_10275 [Planctomycetota bacterium]
MDRRKLESDLITEYGPVLTLQDISQIARLDPEDILDHYKQGYLAGFEPVQVGDPRFTAAAVAEWLVALADGQADDEEDEDEDEDEDDEEEGDESGDDRRTVVVRRVPRRR